MAGVGRTPSGWTLGSAVDAIKEVGHRVKDLTTAFVPDCPNWKVADERLTAIAAERLDIRLMRHLVETPAEAERLRFHGSPSILVDGVDVFAEPGSEVGLSCRRYLTPDGYEGAPTLEQLRAVLAGA